MVKPMRTWEIAKLLLERCDSPQDVDQVLETLHDRLAFQELCAMLGSFASGPHADASTSAAKNTPALLQEAEDQTIRDSVKALPDSSKATMSEQLEILFRSYGMTNKQVEQWFITNFQIDVPMGNGSLGQYLTKVLREVDLGLGNRILAAAQKRTPGDSSKPSELKDYWDKLDKQFTGVQ